jgi:hypothetical protein
MDSDRNASIFGFYTSDSRAIGDRVEYMPGAIDACMLFVTSPTALRVATEQPWKFPHGR